MRALEIARALYHPIASIITLTYHPTASMIT